MAATLDSPPALEEREEGDAERFAPGCCVAGRYRAVRHIADGGMGRVYEAEDLLVGGRVALKSIHPRLSRRARAVERFRREIQLARRITHPNVCRVFDIALHRSGELEVPVLTMELLEGETLADRLGRGRLSEEDARAIAAQLAAACDAAHDLGIVHRDLKSHNVMLVGGGPAGRGVRVVVTDFGLATLTDGSSDEAATRVTVDGALLGTPAYMAPEQMAGGPFTARVDIYAFGVLLFEMVTGELPFAGPTPLAVAAARLVAPPPSACARRPELDSAWDRVIARCLAREPADRFLRAGAAVAALDPAPPPARSRVRLIGALAAAGALLAAAGVVLDGATDSPPPPAVVDRPALDAGDRIAAGVALLGLGRSAEARDSLSRTRDELSAAGDRRGAADAATQLAMAEISLGELAAARRDLVAASAWYRQAGDDRALSWTVYSEAFAAMATGDLRAAGPLYREAAALAAAGGLDNQSGYAALGLARIAVASGDLAAAESALATAQRFESRAADPILSWYARHEEGLVAQASGQLERARRAWAGAASGAILGDLRASSELSIARLDVETGEPLGAELVARRHLAQRSASEPLAATARIVLAAALAAQERWNEARTALAEVGRTPENIEVRVELAVVLARVDAGLERATTIALARLGPLATELTSRGLVLHRLELDLAAALIESDWGDRRAAGRSLDAVVARAHRRGLLDLARRASAAQRRNRPASSR